MDTYSFRSDPLSLCVCVCACARTHLLKVKFKDASSPLFVLLINGTEPLF